MRQTQKVGPEFRLRNDHELRAQDPQARKKGKREIHRKVKTVLFSKAFAGQCLSAIRSSGDDNPVFRKAAVKFLDQTTDSEHFPDRDSMDPDHRLSASRSASSPQPRRNVTEALGKSLAVLAMAQHLERPVRRAQEHTSPQKQAVKEID